MQTLTICMLHHYHWPLWVHCRTKASHIIGLSISGYSNKTSNLISPSRSLCTLPSFIIPELTFCNSNSLSVCRMTCPVNIHFFIVLNMSSTLVCSLIHYTLLLSFHVMLNIIILISFGALWSFLFYVWYMCTAYITDNVYLELSNCRRCKNSVSGSPNSSPSIKFKLLSS